MVKIRYTTYYPRIKVREAEIWNVVLSEDKYGLAVHYERCAGNPGLHYSVLNTYMNSEDGESYLGFLSALERID